MFCMQLLRAQITKVQKRQSNCQSFLRFQDLRLQKSAHRTLMKLKSNLPREKWSEFHLWP